ncbi:uncharacterized protein LOC133807443 [Humulus lupulus]|uniref:uncharacterized protein LOC133807443 n=1 Tax=Humulus lupulus TaxID=3486 RepID=UPI002B408A78|nr:uncharacterized protein LOC133807443 [Humulus lupulus]
MAMETVIVDRYSSSSISVGYNSNKQMMIRTTPKKNSRVSSGHYYNKPSENIAPATANMYGAGIIQRLPPPLSFSNSSSSSSSLYPNNNPYRHQRQPNPPLLPLPLLPLSSSSPITRGRSCPRTNTKNTNGVTRNHSLTPKKSKSNPAAKVANLMKSESLVIASTNRLGPDPNDLPKALTTRKSRVCSVEDLDKFSGSVFSLAPPPSSLPLPRFSLKPKLSTTCNAEAAAGIDAGATDNLRRLLRLR